MSYAEEANVLGIDHYTVMVLSLAPAMPGVSQALTDLAHRLQTAGVHVVSVETVQAVQDWVEGPWDEAPLGAVLVGLNQAAPTDPTLTALLHWKNPHVVSVPIYVMMDREQVGDLPADWLDRAEALISIGSEAPDATRDRIMTGAAAYRAASVPPFFRALRDYTEHGRYPWHTPGHFGGEALGKHPAGQALYAFYGANLFRADICSSVPELGSVLEHEGPVLDAEREAARVYRADRSYFVTNGTSMSNHIAVRSIARHGDVVLVDRNCHKSILNALIMTGSIPVFMLPNRNGQGLIGPVRSAELTASTIRQRIHDNPLVPDDARPALAVVTNSTYDGTMYNMGRAIAALGDSTDVVLADEAWISYAPFHPIFVHGFAMGAPRPHDGPTVISTTSIHKTLTALSQGSLLNIREGRHPLPHERFNEAFMLHTSTSPQYSILASLDVAVRMMQGEAGRTLVDGAIRESIEFRRAVTAQAAAQTQAGGWWFQVWQPDDLFAASSDEERLTAGPAAWSMSPGAAWHGFQDIPDTEYAQLDPTKVTILTPGVDTAGVSQPFGIPAPLVAGYLREHGVVVEKTGFYSVLFLFTIAVNPGQTDSLIAALNHFKRDYDNQEQIEDVMPTLYAQFPDRYRNVSLPQLAQEMHEVLRAADTATILEQVYASLPVPAVSPTAAFEQLMAGEVDLVPLKDLGTRTAAVISVVYPPGIPVIVPGERFDNPSGRAVIEYLKVFEQWEREFPGFENEVQGVERTAVDGQITYAMFCLREPS